LLFADTLKKSVPVIFRINSSKRQSDPEDAETVHSSAECGLLVIAVSCNFDTRTANERDEAFKSQSRPLLI
jgi:hypothetical protein